MTLNETGGIRRRQIVPNLVGNDKEFGIYSKCNEKILKGLGREIA